MNAHVDVATVSRNPLFDIADAINQLRALHRVSFTLVTETRDCAPWSNMQQNLETLLEAQREKLDEIESMAVAARDAI
jgi:hypothetical protein